MIIEIECPFHCPVLPPPPTPHAFSLLPNPLPEKHGRLRILVMALAECVASLLVQRNRGFQVAAGIGAQVWLARGAASTTNIRSAFTLLYRKAGVVADPCGLSECPDDSGLRIPNRVSLHLRHSLWNARLSA